MSNNESPRDGNKSYAKACALLNPNPHTGNSVLTER